MNPEEMEKLEKNARELILAITEKTLKTLKDNGLLKEPSSLQKLRFSNPEISAFLEKFKAPKYDPCRLLKKGDRVQVKRRNGRCNGKHGEYLREAFCTVIEDETRNELVRVLHNCTEYRLDPAYLELVTPVEELEPYTCGKGIDEQNLYKNNELFAEFETPEDAARVCKLLNAEYRKEQSNN